MTSIQTDGFLSDEALNRKFDLALESEFKDLFLLATDINRLAMGIMSEPIPSNTPAPIPLMYNRVVENFQAIYLLLAKRIIPPSKVIIRSMLECTFQLVAMQKNQSLVQDYLDHSEEERFSALCKIAKSRGALPEKPNKDDIHQLYPEQSQTVDEIRLRRPKNSKCEKKRYKKATATWAEEAEMIEFYRVHYMIYSNATHGNAIALEDHLEGNVAAFGPTDNGLFDCMVCAILSLAHSITAMASIKKISIDTEFKQLRDRLAAIHTARCDIKSNT